MGLINKAEVIKILYNSCENCPEGTDCSDCYTDELISKINKLSMYDDKPVKAHWIICSDGYYPYCSACKAVPYQEKMTEYCPSCGAWMKEESKW